MSMVRRCYSDADNYKRYRDCYVCEDWSKFSNFKEWTISQQYDGMSLDKDLRNRASNIYSPDTCVYLTQRLNSNISSLTKKVNIEFPIGVHKRDNQFISQIYTSEEGKRHLGMFKTSNQAHFVWLKEKIKVFEDLYKTEKYNNVSLYLEALLDTMYDHLDNEKEFFWKVVS